MDNEFGAAARAVAGSDRSGVGADDSVDEGKAEAMAGGIAAPDAAGEQVSADLGIEAGAIVADD
jgi:hypothetical protein